MYLNEKIVRIVSFNFHKLIHHNFLFSPVIQFQQFLAKVSHRGGGGGDSQGGLRFENFCMLKQKNLDP